LSIFPSASDDATTPGNAPTVVTVSVTGQICRSALHHDRQIRYNPVNQHGGRPASMFTWLGGTRAEAHVTTVVVMISEEFLRILRCPLSRQPLKLADKPLIARVNAAIEERRIVNRVGERVSRRCDGGLINEAVTLLYPIHDEIPCLLVDEAIALEQLEQRSET
jgi:uncharacterized protein YbaR (Trm112 family)